MAVDRDWPIPVRPSPERIEMLRRLAEAHKRWTAKYLSSTPFHPEGRPDGSDYNLHYLDVEASPEQLDELFAESREILGLDPQTGARPGLVVRHRRREI